MLAKAEELQTLSDDELLLFGEAHPGWKVERVDGGLFMTPTYSSGGIVNSALTAFLHSWGRDHGFVCFDSSTGFTMSGGDVLIPDGSLVAREIWDSVGKDVQNSYAALHLDVVVEIVSATDRVAYLVRKCERYLADGHKYVLLLDPIRKRVQSWGMVPPNFPAPEAILAEILR